MKVKIKKKKKSLLKKIFSSINGGRFRGLSYFMEQEETEDFDGQDLVDEQRTKARGLTVFLPLLYVVIFCGITFLIHVIANLYDGKLPTDFSFIYFLPYYQYNFFHGSLVFYNFAMNGIALLMTIFVSLGATLKLRHKYRKVAYGQKGDSKLATLEMVQNQYKEIPEKDGRFGGYGGIPITHYLNKYFVDDSTVCTLVLGTSRSGKGELIVFPMIDNISRGTKQASMIVNDPKGELFAGSYEKLKERGYNIQLLNLDDPLRSGVTYNPLELVIQSFEVGDYEEASKRAKTFSDTLFSKGASGDNAIFYTTGSTAVSAIVLALCDYAFATEWTYSPLPLVDSTDKEIQFKKDIQRDLITMYNVSQLFNQLGGCYYQKGAITVNALDEFFNSLPQQHIASLRYGATRMASDKSKGNIFLTVMDALSMFQSPMNAKMNSANSLDLKTIGYPQYIDMKLNPDYTNRIITLNFKDKEDTLIDTYYQSVGAKGLVNFSYEIPMDQVDYLEINLVEATEFGDISKLDMYHQKAKKLAVYEIPKETGKATIAVRKMLLPLKESQQKDVERLIYTHTTQPVALFMNVPDYDNSNHAIGTIFINQLYTLLASQAKFNDISGRCSRRVHFLLDEFGNMPMINKFSSILTVSAGRELLFTFFLQSYKQLENAYGQEGYAIKDAPQVTIFIKSTDSDTVEEISSRVGHRTVEEESLTNKHADVTNSSNRSAEKERLLTPERVGQIAFGETIVIRNIISDNYGRVVRPFPIFNTKTTVLPPRFKLLADQYNPKRNINTINVQPQHLNYDLEEHLIPLENFVVDLKQAKLMRLKNKGVQEVLAEQDDFAEAIEQQIIEIKTYFSELEVSNDYSKEDQERFISESTLIIDECRKIMKDIRMNYVEDLAKQVSKLESDIVSKQDLNLINTPLKGYLMKLISIIIAKSQMERGTVNENEAG